MKYLSILIALIACPSLHAEQWKTYRDAKLGIEFQYPADWNCSWEEANQATLMLKPASEHPPYVGFQLWAKNPRNLPVETWYKTTQRPGADAHMGTFAGQPAMVVTSSKGDARHIVYEITRPGGNILGVVTRTFPADPASQTTVEKILNSCKFTH